MSSPPTDITLTQKLKTSIWIHQWQQVQNEKESKTDLWAKAQRRSKKNPELQFARLLMGESPRPSFPVYIPLFYEKVTKGFSF